VREGAKPAFMKTRLPGALIAVGIVSAALLLTGCGPQLTQSSSQPALASTIDEALVLKSADGTAAEGDQELAPDPPLANSTVTTLEEYKPLPEGLELSPAAADLLALIRNGSEPELLFSFIANVPERFELGADQIIYFNDIGVPPKVITAMLEHDHARIPAAENFSVVADPSEFARMPALAEGADYQQAPGPEYPIPSLLDTEGNLPETIRVNYELPPAPRARFGIPLNVPEVSEIPTVSPMPVATVSFEDFYGALAPYGNWVEVAGQGRCWQPAAAVRDPSWRPYCDRGHWVYSDGGWYWLSEYSWGWAPFHYGRWFQHAKSGWCWRPDTTWGPAWVCWRTTPKACGWAPLPPGAGHRPGRGWVFDGKLISGAQGFSLAPATFSFVPITALREHNLRNHLIASGEVAHVFPRTVPGVEILENHEHIVSGAVAQPPHLPSHRTSGTSVPVPIEVLCRIPGQARPGQNVTHRPGVLTGQTMSSGNLATVELRRALAPGTSFSALDDRPALIPGAPAIAGNPQPALQTGRPAIAPAPTLYANQNALVAVHASSRPDRAATHRNAEASHLATSTLAAGSAPPFWVSPSVPAHNSSRTEQNVSGHHAVAGFNSSSPQRPDVRHAFSPHIEQAPVLERHNAHIENPAIHSEPVHQHPASAPAIEAHPHPQASPPPPAPPSASHVKNDDSSGATSHGQRR
jgi:hypothetical protein